MKFAVFSILALGLLAAGPSVRANELDHEGDVANAQRLAADLPQTVVIKAEQNGRVSVLQSKDLIPAGMKVAPEAAFSPVVAKADANGKMRGELDRDSSSANWYFVIPNYYGFNYGLGFNNYFYPQFNYYGYNYYYQPYFNYYYNNAYYYYYRWF